MSNNGIDNPRVMKFLVWVPLFIIVISLVTGMALRANVEVVADDGLEMVQTMAHLDNPASLKTIIVTLTQQYVKAEHQWTQALTLLTLLLFLVSCIAMIMWIRLHQLWRQYHRRSKK